jgi:hypothetical protein
MEVVVPLFALTGLYLIDKQKKEEEHENFENQGGLPNTNIADVNYLQEDRVESSELDKTAELTVLNKFNNQSGVYTDKYFQPSQNKSRESNNNLDYVSLSGQRVSGNYFEHNNMTPYFGGNIRGATKDANSYEGLLDSYTGTGSQDVSKQEQSPLFAPDDNVQWAHGTPNQTDFVKSRINPSMRMANVNPFEEKQVAPGLGLGYTTEGAEGFNSGMMNRESWQPKTVDELRVDSNPRASGISMMGHEGPANSHIKQIATSEQMGIMEKHRPERSFVLDDRNTGDDIGRLFVTGGLEKGQSLRSIPVERHVTRPDTSTDYMGVAGTQNEAAYVPGEYMPTHMQQLGAVPMGVANAQGRSSAGEHDYSIRSNKAYANNRSANQQESYFGAVGNSLGAAVAPLLDMLKPSRKENMIGTMRPYQNPGSAVGQSYVFNPSDKPAPTIRETTENSKFHLNVNANQNGGAYHVTEHQVADTARNETGNFYYAGNAGAGAGTRQTTSYESGYNQRNNDIKSSTIDGYMVKGNMSLLNSDMNVTQKERDTMLKNERAISGNMPYKAPDVSNMGQLSGNVKEYNSKIQMERTAPEMMLNLQSNPYVVDYKKGL